MDKWEVIAQDPKHRRLNTIEETRWWSKANAVNKLFGTLPNKHSSLYVTAVEPLHAIENEETYQPDPRAYA